MLLADLARASAVVGATRSRTAKVAAVADVLGRAGPGEIGPAAAMLAGRLRQGRVGVGWAQLSAVDVTPATAPVMTILDVDQVVSALAAMTGPIGERPVGHAHGRVCPGHRRGG